MYDEEENIDAIVLRLLRKGNTYFVNKQVKLQSKETKNVNKEYTIYYVE